MVRRGLTALCLCAFVLSLGCSSGGGSDKPNPSNLEYGKEGPPKRGDIPPPKGR